MAKKDPIPNETTKQKKLGALYQWKSLLMEDTYGNEEMSEDNFDSDYSLHNQAYDGDEGSSWMACEFCTKDWTSCAFLALLSNPAFLQFITLCLGLILKNFLFSIEENEVRR